MDHCWLLVNMEDVVNWMATMPMLLKTLKEARDLIMNSRLDSQCAIHSPELHHMLCDVDARLILIERYLEESEPRHR